MFLRGVVFFLLAVGFLGGCSSATELPPFAVPVPTQVSSATPSLVPSLTHAPSATATPTLTPFPPLSGDGPYLILENKSFSRMLLIYDSDGSGRRILTLPEDCYVRNRDLAKAISPDGKWLICYTGSLRSVDLPIRLPVSMYIVNVADGTYRKVADIASEGYEDKLVKVADELKLKFPECYKEIDGIDWTFGALVMDFEWNIFAHAWSPDSRQIAFAAQIDGDSSDVYTFDLELDKIQRVEDSLLSVAAIQWSPTGEYILFQNSMLSMNYSPTSLHIVKVGGLVVKEPKDLASFWFGRVVDWLSPEVVLLTDGTDTTGPSSLFTVNVATGKITNIWEGLYSSVAIDKENQMIGVSSSDFSNPQMEFFTLTYAGDILSGVTDYYYHLQFRGGDTHRFLAIRPTSLQTEKYEFIGIDGIGQYKPIASYTSYAKTSISPNYEWMLIYYDDGAYLFNANDELVRSFDLTGIGDVLWRPDSKGFFFERVEALYYLSVPSGEPIYVDGCTTKDCYINLRSAAWLP
jgi:Tol biopolymer transport system component